MVGERLSELRKDNGMTQRELSELLSVSVTTISGYENNQNNPNDEIKVHIARILNVSLDYLLGAIDDELPLIRSNTLLLPKSFTKEARLEVIKYIGLLNLKYKKS